MKRTGFLSALIFLVATSYASAVEYLVTDTSGNTIDTTNALDLGQAPVAKTIQVWLTYTDAERNLANPAGGLFSGGARLTPANAQVANIFPGPSTPYTNPGSQWNPFNTQFNSLTVPTVSQITFSRGSTNTDPTQSVGIQLPATTSGVGKLLLFEALISPGATINPSGTNFTMIPVSTAPFRYGTAATSLTAFAVQPNGAGYTFTVVPEPTTYALGAVATAMLGGVGYFRRKKVAKVVS